MTDLASATDTVVRLIYTGADAAGTSAQLRLFELDGSPARSASGLEVCNPCVLALGSGQRVQSFRVQDAFDAAGGVATAAFDGFALVELFGDVDNVAVAARAEQKIGAPTGPSATDLALVAVAQTEQVAGAAAAPWIFGATQETNGHPSEGANLRDALLDLTLTSVLRGASAGSADVEVTLVDDAGNVVGCTPCVLTLDAATPHIRLSFEDAIETGGATVQNTRYAALVEPSGPQAAHVVASLRSLSSLNDASLRGVVVAPQQSFLGDPGATSSTVIPHVAFLPTPTPIDTRLVTTSLAGLGSLGAGAVTVSTWFQEGAAAAPAPMRSVSSIEVCNPCTATLDAANRFDDRVVSSSGNGIGGIPPSETFFAVVNTEGVAPGGTVVAAERRMGTTLGASAGAQVARSAPPTARTVLVPHVLEKGGVVDGTQFTFDTTMFLTYSGGAPGQGSDLGATVETFLYDDTGAPLRSSNGTAVCDPCSNTLGGGGPRKAKLSVNDLVEAAGGFGGVDKVGFAVLVLGGADPDRVSVQGFVTQSHSSTFDLSVFGFEPQAVAAAPN